MGIIKKTILIIIVIFTVILASSFFYLRFFILNGFSSLETDQIELDTNHVLKLISTQAVELEKSATDYAMWDDLYYFANGQDDSFNTEVLRISVENLSVNLISVIDTDYNLLFSFLYDPADKKEIGLSTTSLQALSGEIKPAVSGIHSSPEITNTSGIFNIDGKPALFAAAKIFKSDRSGDPAGYFIISKYMDRSMADFLSEELAHPVKFIDISRINSQNDYTQVLKNIKNSKSSLFIKYLSLDQAFSYSVLKDISGNDVLLVEVTHSRDVYRNGLTATWNFFYIFALIAAISGITIILSLRLFVLNRLTALSDSAEKMIFESSVTKTLHSKGNDEKRRRKDQGE
jgi:sensor domain CHASE-containing protein